MSDGKGWDALIADLYTAAIDQEAAARLPTRLTTLVGGSVASIWRLDTRSLVPMEMPMTNMPEAAAVAYSTHYYRFDPWANIVYSAQYNRAMRGSEVVDNGTLSRSLYYNEFSAQHDMFHLTAALVPLGSDGRTAGAVSVMRARSADAFDTQSVAFLERMLPHLQSAFRLREQIEASSALLRAAAVDVALDLLGLPAVILDGHGIVFHANARAEHLPIIRACLLRGGKRTFPSHTSRDDQTRLTAMIADAARGGSGGQAVLRLNVTTLLATITPLPERLAQLVHVGPGFVLLVLRPLEKDWDPGPACSVFHLTRAEADAACALVAGNSPDEIAALRGVKVSTVRTLLQRAQTKVGARNLRELVRTLCSLS